MFLTIRIEGRVARGGQTGLIYGLSEGVLEDERDQEVSRRQPMGVLQARVGRRSKTSCGAGVATRGETAKLDLLRIGQNSYSV